MAITKVAQFASSPASTADYQAQNAHINAFIQQMTGGVLHLTEWTTTTVPQIAQGVYLRHAGVLYIVDTADFTIATGDLSAAGTYYIKLTTSGDSLAVAWEDTLTSYAWSVAYQGLYNGTSQILPYNVYYDGASSYAKYKNLIIDEDLSIGGALAAASVNTGTALKTKVVNIGDWNMDTESDTTVAHGITASKIRDISCIIRNDDDDWYNLAASNSATADDGGSGATDLFGVAIQRYDSTYVYLTRSGIFNSTYYNATSYNRGWLTITYIP